MSNNQLLSYYYSEHRGELQSFIAVRILDADEAEDMVQDIFLRLLRGHHLITPQTLPALVHTLARHAVSDHYRRRRVHEQYEHYIKHHADTTAETESIVNARQLAERMERTLARLPQSCCTVYRLHIYDGMKVSDIAQHLELPYKQVENRLAQARKTVRTHLG
jgi:RNA polymerase sigma-70 factor (ECF subfamily)